MIGISLDIPEVAVRGGGLRAPSWVLTGAAVDVDFVNNQAWDGVNGQLVTVASLFSITRASNETYIDASGISSIIGPGTLAYGTAGLQVMEGRTNVVLQNNDLTNAAWTAATATTAKDQTGPDGVINSASSVLATAGNATVLQAITLGSSARFQTAYVKRLVGTGEVDMTMDNGTTWTAVTVTAAWTRVTIPTQTLANPTVGFRLVTNGDKIAVALVQNENGATPTAAIPTTTVSVARAADNISATGALATVLTTGVGTVFADVGPSAEAGAPRIIGASNGGSTVPSFAALSPASNVVSVTNTTNLTAALPSGTTATVASKIASGFDGTGRSLVVNNGALTSDALVIPTATTIFIGARAGSSSFLDANIRRLTAWTARLPDARLQVLTQ